MKTLSEVVVLIGRVDRVELHRWIELGWVAPARRDGERESEPAFSEVDIARVRLICDLRHDLAVDPSCSVQDPLCGWSGTFALGATCACNADCNFGAPFCLGIFVEGERRSVCSAACGDEMPCPSGFSCCSLGAGRPYCIDMALGTAAGAACSS